MAPYSGMSKQECTSVHVVPRHSRPISPLHDAPSSSWYRKWSHYPAYSQTPENHLFPCWQTHQSLSNTESSDHIHITHADHWCWRPKPHLLPPAVLPCAVSLTPLIQPTSGASSPALSPGPVNVSGSFSEMQMQELLAADELVQVREVAPQFAASMCAQHTTAEL